ncbi:MAG: SUMF1/EgtB/PvdO family nonheme iron enzyme, partial [Rhodobacteraceae bacterium]|nr:SUMF1/EgtB/PvdO family nonheme iron enzyme [Paracoccaceae bacterium]
MQPFLKLLETDGIRLTVRDYVRISLVLQTGGEWTLTRLRDTLLALLAKNVEQQEILLQRFDQCFTREIDPDQSLADLDIQRVLADLKQLAQGKSLPKKPAPPRKPRKKLFEEQGEPDKPARFSKTAQVLMVGLLLVLVLAGIWQVGLSPKIEPTPTPGPTVTPTPAPTPGEEILTEISKLTRRYPNVPHIAEVEAIPLSELAPDVASYAIYGAAGVLLAILGYGLYLRQTHKIPEDQPPEWDEKKLRHFSVGTIGGSPGPRFEDDLLNHLADSMGYFRSQKPGRRLNVPASIQATLKRGGIPELAFYQRKQIRSLLILEDEFAEPLAWNTLAGELAEGMSRRGVPVLYGGFRGSPAQFMLRNPPLAPPRRGIHPTPPLKGGIVPQATPFAKVSPVSSPGNGSVCYLEDFEDQRSGYLVLIFTDGKSLVRSASSFVLEQLARWPMVAWMELREPRAWDNTATLPDRHGIPLYPATPDGVRQAFRRFMTEQGGEADFSAPAQTRAGSPLQAEASFDAYVEALLGDALLWAQDCALLQPVSAGLADTLRQKFYPHLPYERIERLYTLPGTVKTVSGLRFSEEVQRTLRTGFLIRRSDKEQEQALRFLLQEIANAEPAADEDSLAHLAWEAVRERVRLEVEQDNDLERLAQLAKTPLGDAIEARLENFVLAPESFDSAQDDRVPQHDRHPERSRRGLPLRRVPDNKHALQRLARIAGHLNLPILKAYPVALANWLVLGLLTLLCLGCSGWYWNYLQSLGDLQGTWQVMGPRSVPATLQIQEGDSAWKTQATDTLAVLTKTRLEPGRTYQLILLGDAVSTTTELKPVRNRALQVNVGAADRERRCYQEYPAIGLSVQRCANTVKDEDDDKIVQIPTWRSVVGEDMPKNRLLSVGLEFSGIQTTQLQGATQEDALARARNLLLKSGSIDLLYRIQPDANGTWRLAEAFQQIRTEIGGYLSQSQALWWAAGNVPPTSAFTSELAAFDRRILLGAGDDFAWAVNLQTLLNPGEPRLITEDELLLSLQLSAKQVGGSGAPVRLARVPPEEWQDPVTDMEFVWIEGGCFQMGQTEAEKKALLEEIGQEDYDSWYARELPRHEVCVDGFWMAKTEVTNAQYRKSNAKHDSGEWSGKFFN